MSFAPASDEPPDLTALGRAAQRYAQKRTQDRARLESMLRYAQSHLCRNKLLFAYFGYAEDAAEPCGTCDNCVRSREEAADRQVAEAAERRRHAEPPRAAMPAHVTSPETLSAERRSLLEQAITRRRARAKRAGALRIERSAALAVPRPEFALGDVVRHPVWGEGEVTNVAGDTVGAYFPGHGDKLLKAKFLEKVGEL